MENTKESGRTHCPACAREVESYWNFCVKCGIQLKDQIQVEQYSRREHSEKDDHNKDSAHNH